MGETEAAKWKDLLSGLEVSESEEGMEFTKLNAVTSLLNVER